MSTTRDYVLLLHGDEREWRDADEAAVAQAYGEHDEFSRLCGERGHEILGGEELRLSETSLVVRSREGEVQVTEGPFTETVEQLGGYYVIRTADVQDLARLAAMLAGTGAVEIRPIVRPTDQPQSGAAAAEQVAS
ncbi:MULTISPECIES: YciI family protein [unclassified Actinotalea]|uniref:YciI family protein n=1 Tax=unclassified Actinotalea TaxID=2638618 RepID=UPI0015F372BB|nr:MULTISPECIES: YciI family protein [unclassified Actinotalea]